jgi:hypothetical protein
VIPNISGENTITQDVIGIPFKFVIKKLKTGRVLNI